MLTNFNYFVIAHEKPADQEDTVALPPPSSAKIDEGSQ